MLEYLCAHSMRIDGEVLMAAVQKKAVNLRISKDLIDQARDLQINLSQALETSLVDILRDKQKAAWLAENREAVDDYNERVGRQGVFSDGVRRF